MTVTQWICWDTETALIRPGVTAPELACLTYTTEGAARAGRLSGRHPTEWDARIADRSSALRWMRAMLETPSVGFVGHYVAFDFAVMMANDPSLVPLVFAAYRDNRVTCTKLRAQLLDIAAGKFRGGFIDGVYRKLNYTLADLSRRYLGWTLEKDEWRLRYGEFLDVPLDQWPEGARTYPLHDARATAGVWLAQEEHAGNKAGWLDDQFRQARAQFRLTLISAWGLRTHIDGVAKLEVEVEERLTEIQAELVQHGLVRSNGTRDTKAAARRMIDACREQGITADGMWITPVVATEGSEALAKSDYSAFVTQAYETGKGVALDADTCERVDDYVMGLYAELSTLGAVKSKDIVMLDQGMDGAIHTRFDIAASGRKTSSKPNVQNIRRLPGIRECFVPRPGFVYMQADFPGLELKTLAQCAIWVCGYSELAKAINAGQDPHLMLAADMLGLDYDECKRRHKAGDKEVKNARQLAKVANFGYPGGLGYKTFIDFARPQGVVLDEDGAKRLKQQWQGRWTEMREYFRIVGNMCDTPEGYAHSVKQFGSNRVRGKCNYTQTCNTWFQGLGADAMNEAGFQAAWEQYVDTNSPLFGTRTVNDIHDELIGEVKPEHGHGAAHRLAEVMRIGANRWLPDVPFKPSELEPVLMTHWSKNAGTHYHDDGQLLVWDGQDDCSLCKASLISLWHPLTGEHVSKEIAGKGACARHEWKKAG
jgi:DNA polymerase-1